MSLQYGIWWVNEATKEWYDSIWQKQKYIHDSFMEWCKGKKIDSAFEIGAGIGQYSDFFSNKTYHGIDFTPLLKVSKNHKAFNGDFMYHIPEQKYDLVFAHSVIDHVPGIEQFIKKCISMSKGFVYLTHYNGYDETLARHEQLWNEPSNCYFNRISHKKLKDLLSGYKYEIKKITGYRDSTVIIIEC